MADYSSYLKQNKVNFAEHDDIENQGNVDLQEGCSSNNSQTSGGQNVFSTIFSKVKGYVKLSSTENQVPEKQDNSIKGRIARFCEVEKSYTAFFIFLFLGLGLIGLSFIFLPMAILAPQKFVFLFSLGCLITIASFIFYYGTSDFLSMLFNQERRWFTFMFLVSMTLGATLPSVNHIS